VNSLIILAHPNAASFNAAIRAEAEAELRRLGSQVRVHDLYAMGFQPALTAADFAALARGEQPDDVQPLQADITWADLLILIYPTWWGGTPAMLKGYIDRVFAQNFAYGERGGKMIGLLAGKRALIFQTTGESGAQLAAEGTTEATAQIMGGATLAFCGVKILCHEYFFAVETATDAERQGMLAQVRARIREAVGR
jgi:NAD(P)H dehydrogenase (quinone)